MRVVGGNGVGYRSTFAPEQYVDRAPELPRRRPISSDLEPPECLTLFFHSGSVGAALLVPPVGGSSRGSSVVRDGPTYTSRLAFEHPSAALGDATVIVKIWIRRTLAIPHSPRWGQSVCDGR